MRAKVVIHLVSASAALARLLISGTMEEGVEVRVVASPELDFELGAHDQCVVDLGCLPAGMRPERVLRVVRRYATWLLVGSSPIPSEWVPILREDRARVVPLISGRPDTNGLLSALREAIAEPSGTEIAGLVINGEPLLRPLGPLVLAICCRPWSVRRLRELAQAVGTRPRDVLLQCEASGFERAEHLIICVKTIALEQLCGSKGTPLSVARRLVGIRDPSNARRQLKRAQRSSGRAFRQLRSFVA